jgi:hypothetical protein
LFHYLSEQEKGEHVEEEVSPVGVYESARKETIPLISLGDGGWIEDQVIDQLVVGESANGNECCKENDG